MKKEGLIPLEVASQQVFQPMQAWTRLLTGLTKIIIIVALAMSAVFSPTTTRAQNISSSDGYAWGENVGWINFGSTDGDVDVTATALDGYAWGENVGWISLNCTNDSSCATVNYGVTNTSGVLSGYAWGENTGWISFNCNNTSSCASVDYSVLVSQTNGDFSGYAWGENIGWISFNCSNDTSCGAVSYKVATSYLPPSTTTTNQSGGVPLVQQTPKPLTSSKPTGIPSSAHPTPTSGDGGFVPADKPPLQFLTPTILSERISSAIDRFAQQFGGLTSGLTFVVTERPDSLNMLALAGVLGALMSFIWQAFAMFRSTGDLIDFIRFIAYSTPSIIGFHRRRVSWGTVYDSITKQPVAFARVRLLDQNGKILEQSVTDKEGHFGFSPPSESKLARYQSAHLEVKKRGYQFPVHNVSSSPDPVMWPDVYISGRMPDVSERATHNVNVPIEQTAPEGVPLVRLRPHLGLHNSFVALLDGFFWLSVMTAPLAYFTQPTPITTAIFAGFIFVTLMRMIGVHRVPRGAVIDALTGTGVPFARIISIDGAGRVLAKAVADAHGRYAMHRMSGAMSIAAHPGAQEEAAPPEPRKGSAPVGDDLIGRAMVHGGLFRWMTTVIPI